MCGSRKYPYPPPRKIIGNSEGEGEFKGSYFQGVGGVQRKLLFQKVTNHEQNIESNLQSIVNTKTVLLAIDMRLTSLTLMFLFFFVVS